VEGISSGFPLIHSQLGVGSAPYLPSLLPWNELLKVPLKHWLWFLHLSEPVGSDFGNLEGNDQDPDMSLDQWEALEGALGMVRAFQGGRVGDFQWVKNFAVGGRNICYRSDYHNQTDLDWRRAEARQPEYWTETWEREISDRTSTNWFVTFVRIAHEKGGICFFLTLLLGEAFFL